MPIRFREWTRRLIDPRVVGNSSGMTLAAGPKSAATAKPASEYARTLTRTSAVGKTLPDGRFVPDRSYLRSTGTRPRSSLAGNWLPGSMKPVAMRPQIATGR